MSDQVIVVGLGAVGGAVLYQLARRGIPAIGIDRFSPPHAMGSSHGETRITRLAVGEGDCYAPLVRRSHEIWRTLERDEGVSLLDQIGGLIIGAREGGPIHHGKDAFIDRTVAVAESFGIDHEVLDAPAIARRFPQFLTRDDEIGYYEAEAGILFPERCVATQLSAARRLGATIRANERVLDITEISGGARVRTERETFSASRVVVTAGPWIGALLGGPFAAQTKIHRQTVHWFESDAADLYAPERCPIFIWMHGPGQEDYLYGFPQLEPGGGVKLGSERYSVSTDPETADRTVSEAESAEMHARHVQGRLHDISPRRLRAAACHYTVTRDANFIVDSAPGMDRVLAVSACSGHGFKHAAALGEAVAQTVLDGASEIDLAMFRLAKRRRGGLISILQ